MPAYTYRATGTVAQNSNSAALTPGAPAGKAVGDLLILYTGNRGNTVSVASLAPGWTQIVADNDAQLPALEIWMRIADGSATDTPSPDWDGAQDSIAWIEAYHGDVYTDLATIVAHTSGVIQAGGQASDIPIPSLTITTHDTLVIAYGIKIKTATSDDATTISAGGGLTKRAQVIQTGTALMGASASAQQTTATNYDGSNFTRDGTDEAVSGEGVVLSLKTAAAGTSIAAISHYHSMIRNSANG